MTSRPTRRRGRLATSLAAGMALCLTGATVLAGQPGQAGKVNLPNPQPDLVVGTTRLRNSLRISNRTFGSNSCSVVEGCVVPGSRRILEFDTQIQNLGNADAILGQPSARPELFVFSPCHGHYHMLDSLDYSMAYGGTDTIALFDTNTGNVFLRNTNSGGNADVVFSFGGPGLVPLSGDWNADGTSTIGAYNPTTGAFFLKNTNAPGAADVVFTFGAGGVGYVPVVGDWDGSGTDTVGLYSPATGTFFLKNTNAAGVADVTLSFGVGGSAVPIAGDWNGDDIDTVGVYDPVASNYFLRNTNTNGPADVTFSFGGGGAQRPIIGDWDGNGSDTIGVYDPTNGTSFIRNSNSAGVADDLFAFGTGGPGIVEITGDWDYDQKGATLPGIVGLKQAFCWLDSQRVQGSLPGHYDCSNQGITAGWSDVYGRGLDCQWIDITGLPAGNYQLRVSVNDSHTIVTESNYDNNVSVLKVHITAPSSPRAEPQLRVTSPGIGGTYKVGEPVTITWEIQPGSTPTHQEIWFLPTPKQDPSADPRHGDPNHNDPHHDAIARAKLIAEGLGPNVRSFTWIPTEEFVMEIGAQIMVRVQDSNNMVGTDQRQTGLINVVKK